MAIIHNGFRSPCKYYLPGKSILGKTVQALNGLATNVTRSSVLMQLATVNTDAALSSSRATQGAVGVVGDGALNTTRANVNSALVG